MKGRIGESFVSTLKVTSFSWKNPIPRDLFELNVGQSHKGRDFDPNLLAVNGAIQVWKSICSTFMRVIRKGVEIYSLKIPDTYKISNVVCSDENGLMAWLFRGQMDERWAICGLNLNCVTAPFIIMKKRRNDFRMRTKSIPIGIAQGVIFVLSKYDYETNWNSFHVVSAEKDGKKLKGSKVKLGDERIFHVKDYLFVITREQIFFLFQHFDNP